MKGEDVGNGNPQKIYNEYLQITYTSIKDPISQNVGRFWNEGFKKNFHG